MTQTESKSSTIAGTVHHIAACRDGSVELNIIECNGELTVQETITNTYLDQNQRTMHVIEGYLS